LRAAFFLFTGMYLNLSDN